MSTERLPLFPLRVVLFPGMVLPLHIFEPRYRQMIGECLEGDRRFGTCLIRAGEEVGEPAEPYLVGTEAEILDVDQLADGRMLLQAVGLRRFRVVELTQWRPYLAAEITYLVEDPGDGATAIAAQVQERANAYGEAARQALMLLAMGPVSTGPREALFLNLAFWGQQKPLDPRMLSYAVPAQLQLQIPDVQELLQASLPQVPPSDLQALLEEPSTQRRLERILELLSAMERQFERVRHAPPFPPQGMGGNGSGGIVIN